MEPQDISLPVSRPPSPVDSDTLESKQAQSKQWTGIYPPILPPPDIFDLDFIKEDLKTMFKKNNTAGVLHDETGLVNLPVNEKGILILDPVSRYRIEDVLLENMIFFDYTIWIETLEFMHPDPELCWEWIAGLKEAVEEDGLETARACAAILEDERDKRGLTTMFTMEPHRSNRKKEDDQLQEELKDTTGLNVPDIVLHFPPHLRTSHKNQSRKENVNFDSLEENRKEIEPQDMQTQDSHSRSSPPSPDEPNTATPPIDLITLWW